MSDVIVAGLFNVLTIEGLLLVTVGLLAGFFVGVLPGFASSNAAAILLPFSIYLAPESALILMATIYAGAAFAGAVPAILINVPGTAGAAATALEGYPMTRKGKAEFAIAIARMASAVGGCVATLAVIGFIQPMSQVALSFGSVEMFIVAVIGLLLIGSLVGEQPLKALIAGFLGMLIASMSADPQYAQPRLTFGFIELYDRIPFIPAIIGLFGMTEMLALASRRRTLSEQVIERVAPRGGLLRRSLREVGASFTYLLRRPVLTLKSTVIGFSLGILPGVGVTLANFLSYAEAKRSSPNSANFGHGEPDGIVATEASDNAVTAGTMVPTLTLGVPGSPTAAVMLAALYMHGISVGPQLMTNYTLEAYTVLWALFLANLLIIPVGLLLVGPMALVTRLNPLYLPPVVIPLCLIGAFSVRYSLFDVWLTLVFAALGLLFRRFGFPVVPLILGLVLGPLAEANFVRAMLLGRGDLAYFFRTDTALMLWAVAAVLFGVILVRLLRPTARNTAK